MTVRIGVDHRIGDDDPGEDKATFRERKVDAERSPEARPPVCRPSAALLEPAQTTPPEISISSGSTRLVFKRLLTSEIRDARRRERSARFERPIVGPVSRARAWANMLLVDHGVFRLAYLNRHRIGQGKVWRSAQPTPHQLAWFKRQGVRTVISLRGGREHGSWPLQREACERQGLTLVEFVLRSREAPSRETILAAKDFFDTIDYPAIMHCKSGADRAGLGAALYLILHENLPVAEAMGQLSARYGHFRFAKTGILDAFFRLYRREGEAKGLDFLTWVETEYDPEALKRSFRPGFWSDLVVDRIIKRE